MVLVAAMGQRPTGGYLITIDGVYEHNDTLYVDVLEQSPGSGCVSAQVLTAPVFAVLVRQTEQLVAFATRTAINNC